MKLTTDSLPLTHSFDSQRKPFESFPISCHGGRQGDWERDGSKTALSKVQTTFAKVQTAFTKVQTTFAKLQTTFAKVQTTFAKVQTTFGKV